MCNKLFVLAAVFALSLAAFAQIGQKMPFNPDRDLTMVGLSDLVVVGTVVDIQVDENALEEMNDAEYARKAGTAGVATIEVEQVLKGNDVKKITLSFPYYRSTGQLFNQKEPQIYFLKRGPGGYTFTYGGTFRQAEDANAVSDAITNFPGAISVEFGNEPFFFGAERTLKVTIANKGVEPMSFAPHAISLESFAFSPLMKEGIPFRMVNDAEMEERMKEEMGGAIKPGGARIEQKQTTVEPGEELTMECKFSCMKPQAWQMFTPDTYLQMPVAVRGVLRIPPRYDDNKKMIPGTSFSVASEWSNVMVGYELPADLMIQ